MNRRIFNTIKEIMMHKRSKAVLKVVQERSRVSLSQSKAKCPSPEFFIFVFDLKMASFDALLVVFYEI